MSKPILHENSIMLTGTNDVDTLCAPLYKMGVTYFSYVRIYNDGSRFDITNNARICEYYYNTGQYKDYSPEMSPDELPEGFIFVSTSLEDSSVLKTLRNEFNLDHVVAFVQRYKDYHDLWHFGSTPNNPSIVNFYFNNLDLLKSFCFYFKDKGASLIKLYSQERFLTNSEKTKNIMQEKPLNERSNIIASLATDKYFLGEAYEDQYITKREVECINWFSKGKTAQEIGVILGISKRTVDSHIESAKRKLNCYKLPLLIVKAMRLGIITSS
jgi:DNA-binding CsgD family transcriptional regulator